MKSKKSKNFTEKSKKKKDCNSNNFKSCNKLKMKNLDFWKKSNND